jgi:hypothetical protein
MRSAAGEAVEIYCESAAIKQIGPPVVQKRPMTTRPTLHLQGNLKVILEKFIQQGQANFLILL